MCALDEATGNALRPRQADCSVKKKHEMHPQKSSGILSWDVATASALRPRQAVCSVEYIYISATVL